MLIELSKTTKIPAIPPYLLISYIIYNLIYNRMDIR